MSADRAHTQSVLVICTLCICEFTYLLIFIYNSKITTCCILTVICGYAQSCMQNIWVAWHAYSQQWQNQVLFCLLVSTPMVETSVLFEVYLVLFFFCMLLVCCLRWPPHIEMKCCLVSLSTQRLSCALERKYMHWINKLPSGTSFGAIGNGLNVNESTVYIKQSVVKEKHT